ncbi:MAG TPA: hypothetical protein DDW98_05295, partial [Gammaproteobacteria bacterium]|nr:hypothetical protein [Gammaproteobacteria bacterium]
LAAFLTIAWLSKMDHALSLQRTSEAFFQALVRYEDLCAHGVGIMPGLLDALALPPANEIATARMARTLSRNAQAGSVLASTGESALNARQRETIKQMLALHPEIHDSSYLLPGTLRMEGQ